jgi:SAM-dependent methyltransferase
MGNVSTKKWLKGVAYEVAFWNNVYRWNKTYKGMMGWSHYGQAISLEEFNVNEWLQGQDSPLVLDVGCGMSYATGNLYGPEEAPKAIDIHYVDPLARYFNTIIKRYKRDVPSIEFGMVEYLSAFYPAHNVSLVIIQNALDHSSNPIKGILEAIHVLKPGGILYLNHHPNEAVTEHHKGFHQYNIDEENGEMIIWNPYKRISVNALIQGFAEIKVKRHFNGHIIAIIHKRDIVPAGLISHETDIKILCRAIMDLNESRTSLLFCLSTKFRFWKYNIIQFFIQSLSWDTKMRLKKLIKQTS